MEGVVGACWDSGVDGGEESGDRGADIGVYGDIGGVGECEYGRIFGVIGSGGEVTRDRSINKGGEGGGDSGELPRTRRPWRLGVLLRLRGWPGGLGL
jgi:hypothetical protein